MKTFLNWQFYIVRDLCALFLPTPYILINLIINGLGGIIKVVILYKDNEGLNVHV